MRKHVKLFEEHQDGTTIWWFFMAHVITTHKDGSTHVMSPEKFKKFVDIAKKNGIGPDDMWIDSDGIIPCLSFEATESSFMSMMYDLKEEGIMKVDLSDIERVMNTYRKPKPKGDRFIDGEYWNN